jgi:glutamine---fructose-6-phosphate transaminase (isomerizing)
MAQTGRTGQNGAMTGSANASSMFREAREAPSCVAAQGARDRERVAEIAQSVRRFHPRAVLTSARGSSDHAATYARYLIETKLKLLTASASPSVSSVYGVKQDLERCLYLVISQSGRSPDLLAAAHAAKDSGALVVALVNDETAPLVALADHVIPLRAGVEKSVAATKSHLAALTASLNLVAHWAEDDALLQAFAALPQQMEEAWRLDWQAMMASLAPAHNLFVLGRGLGLGAAQEAALKLKETCGLHAEAFSGAEVRHGPMALMRDGLPVLMFVQDDETRPGMEALFDDLRAAGAHVLMAGSEAKGNLSSLPASPAVAPILLTQSFYRWAAMLSVSRGFDPDHPPHLKKVTETL